MNSLFSFALREVLTEGVFDIFWYDGEIFHSLTW